MALTQCDEEETMFTFASGAAVSAMPKDMLPNVPKSGGPENKFHRVATGSKIPDLGGKKITYNGYTQSVTFLTCARDQSTGIGEMCQRMNRVVLDEEGTYIENKVSGRKVPMREENGVFVI